jgi:hypothetical protein
MERTFARLDARHAVRRKAPLKSRNRHEPVDVA